MSHDLTAQAVLFPDLAAKAVVVEMDEEHSSANGGAVLLKDIDRSLGLTESLAGAAFAEALHHFYEPFPEVEHDEPLTGLASRT